MNLNSTIHIRKLRIGIYVLFLLIMLSVCKKEPSLSEKEKLIVSHGWRLYKTMVELKVYIQIHGNSMIAGLSNLTRLLSIHMAPLSPQQCVRLIHKAHGSYQKMKICLIIPLLL
jgi:hypothetical protein